MVAIIINELNYDKFDFSYIYFFQHTEYFKCTYALLHYIFSTDSLNFSDIICLHVACNMLLI